MTHPLAEDPRSVNGLAFDPEQLLAFENGFDPAYPAASGVRVLGHGRFTTIFEIDALEGVALKRLPPFPTAADRALHERALNAYHMLLKDTVGLDVVPQRCIPVTNQAGEYVLYIAQARQPAAAIADRVLAVCDDDTAAEIFAAVLQGMLRVWYRNEIEKELDVPGSLMGLDARLSNWSVAGVGSEGAALRYLDTGTPFFRRLGKDRLEPELFLQSVPSTLSGLVRPRFVGDVLERYYDLRLVLLDFLGGLHVIGQEARVPLALELVNHVVLNDAEDLYIDPFTAEEVARYARQETRFWRRFLTLSRVKRFTSTKVLRRRYHFSLPG